MSHWQAAARKAIRDTLRAHRTEVLTHEELIKLVDAAYPFGERAHWPYKVWLTERRKLVHALQDEGGLASFCPACGSMRGVPCLEIGEPEVYAAEMHEARVRPVQRGGSGALFGEP